MLPTAAAFVKACDEAGLKYREPTVTDSGKTIVRLGVTSAHGNSYTVTYIFDAGNAGVAIRIYGLVTGRREIYSRMVARCNTMNKRFSWVKFVVDDDLDLNLEADCIIAPETAGTVCVEMFYRFVSIARDAYPAILSSHPLPEEIF